jgi:hypothetical protein
VDKLPFREFFVSPLVTSMELPPKKLVDKDGEEDIPENKCKEIKQ